MSFCPKLKNTEKKNNGCFMLILINHIPKRNPVCCLTSTRYPPNSHESSWSHTFPLDRAFCLDSASSNWARASSTQSWRACHRIFGILGHPGHRFVAFGLVSTQLKTHWSILKPTKKSLKSHKKRSFSRDWNPTSAYSNDITKLLCLQRIALNSSIIHLFPIL